MSDLKRIMQLISPTNAQTHDSIALLWEKQEGAKSYRIFLNQQEVAEGSATDYTVEGLESDTQYTFKVQALDECGQVAAESEPLVLSTQVMPKMYCIEAFGAIGDGKTDCTKAIQKAIDACDAGGMVYIPKGTFVTGALFLKSHMTLHIAEGGKLLGSPFVKDYPIIPCRFEGVEVPCYASLVNVGTLHGEAVEEITLSGKGVIDANGALLAEAERREGKACRGRAICMRNARKLYLKDVTVRQSPAWCIHFIYCKEISVNGVKVHTKYDEEGHAYENIINGDGIDPDSSNNVYIFHSLIASQDDCIAIKSGRDEAGRMVGRSSENIRITNCQFKSGFGVAVGSEMSGDVRDVLVEDCDFQNTFSVGSIKAPRGRGGVIEHIVYKDITHKNTDLSIQESKWFRGALLIDSFYGEACYEADLKVEKNEGTPCIREITFKNVEINTLVSTVIYMVGLPEEPLGPITLEHIIGKGKQGITIKNVTGLAMDDVRISTY